MDSKKLFLSLCAGTFLLNQSVCAFWPFHNALKDFKKTTTNANNIANDVISNTGRTIGKKLVADVEKGLKESAGGSPVLKTVNVTLGTTVEVDKNIVDSTSKALSSFGELRRDLWNLGGSIVNAGTELVTKHPKAAVITIGCTIGAWYLYRFANRCLRADMQRKENSQTTSILDQITNANSWNAKTKDSANLVQQRIDRDHKYLLTYLLRKPLRCVSESADLLCLAEELNNAASLPAAKEKTKAIKLYFASTTGL